MDQIARDCRATSGAVAVERAVAARLKTAIGFDAWCVLTIDPAVAMPTGGYHEEGVPHERLPRLVEIEAGGQDALALPDLARGAHPVATLGQVTGGCPAQSARYREILEPSGLGDELRATFRTESGTWGALIMFRAADGRGFSEAEVELVTRSTSDVAAAIRREMVLAEIEHSDHVDGPGLLLLDRSLTRVHATPTAERWLTEIDDGIDRSSKLPYAVMTAGHRAIIGNAAAPSRTRLRTRSGRWITVHAEHLGQTSQISVIIEPARPTEIAELVADAYGLTPRERQVVRLLALGYARAEIAEALVVSRHTVDDHTKNIFAKLGVGSRGQLTAKLFFDHNYPRIADDVPVGGTGWFIR